MGSFFSNAYSFVAELVRQAKEDGIETNNAKIEFALEKEKLDIEMERKFTLEYDRKVKQGLTFLIKKYAVQSSLSGLNILELASREEKEQITCIEKEFSMYAKKHLNIKVYSCFEELNEKGAMRAQDFVYNLGFTLEKSKYALERLYRAGYVEKENREGKEVYISKYIEYFTQRSDREKLQELFKRVVKQSKEAAYKQNEKFTMQVKQTGERESTGENFFKYAKEHLDSDSYKILEFIHKNHEVSVKEAAKKVKCNAEHTRYLLQRLYEAGYIEKIKIKNKNVYMSRF